MARFERIDGGAGYGIYGKRHNLLRAIRERKLLRANRQRPERIHLIKEEYFVF